MIFGYNWRIRRLRKKWDRMREAALKLKRQERTKILEELDSIENNLRVLEEEKLSRIVKAKLCGEVKNDMEKVSSMIEAQKEREEIKYGI